MLGKGAGAIGGENSHPDHVRATRSRHGLSEGRRQRGGGGRERGRASEGSERPGAGGEERWWPRAKGPSGKNDWIDQTKIGSQARIGIQTSMDGQLTLRKDEKGSQIGILGWDKLGFWVGTPNIDCRGGVLGGCDKQRSRGVGRGLEVGWRLGVGLGVGTGIGTGIGPTVGGWGRNGVRVRDRDRVRCRTWPE